VGQGGAQRIFKPHAPKEEAKAATKTPPPPPPKQKKIIYFDVLSKSNQ
jgi:hypothetical protein